MNPLAVAFGADGAPITLPFESMRSNARRMAPGGERNRSRKDTKNFFHKGTNGRWKGVLSDEQVAAYDSLARRELGEDLADWLEFGGTVERR